MNNEDKETFRNTLTGLSEVYSKEVTPELLKAYWWTLREFNVDDFTRAVSEHMKDTEKGAFFPKPADLIAIIKGTERQSYLARIYDLQDTSWAD